jgi:hypothetical protein
MIATRTLADPLLQAYEELLSTAAQTHHIRWTPAPNPSDRHRLRQELAAQNDRLDRAIEAYVIEHDAAFGR